MPKKATHFDDDQVVSAEFRKKLQRSAHKLGIIDIREDKDISQDNAKLLVFASYHLLG
jgi:hypothetical protein